MKKVLLTGTASAHNKGDATMQLVVSTELEAALGDDVRVAIASPSPSFDVSAYPDRLVIASVRRSRLFPVSLAAAGLWGALNRVFGVRADAVLFTDELRWTESADLVVDLSGDMLTEDYGFLVGFSHFIPLIMARWLRTPYVICAQSIGPFSRLTPIARWILRRAADITIREDVTRERVAGLGLELETTADVSFLLEPDRVGAAEVLEAAGVPGDKRLVGLSVSPILKERYESAHPGESFAQAIAESVNTALEGEDVHIVLIPHVTGPAERHDDRIVAREVAPLLDPDHTRLEGEIPPRVLKGVIARCDVVLGARMHANMGALSQGVPVVALSYSHKTQGIMDSFGQGDLVVDGRRPLREELSADIVRVMDERDARAAVIRSHHDAVVAESRRNITRILDRLDA